MFSEDSKHPKTFLLVMWMLKQQ